MTVFSPPGANLRTEPGIRPSQVLLRRLLTGEEPRGGKKRESKWKGENGARAEKEKSKEKNPSKHGRIVSFDAGERSDQYCSIFREGKAAARTRFPLWSWSFPPRAEAEILSRKRLD